MIYVVVPAVIVALIALIAGCGFVGAKAFADVWGTRPLPAWAERLRIKDAEQAAYRAVIDAAIEEDEGK